MVSLDLKLYKSSGLICINLFTYSESDSVSGGATSSIDVGASSSHDVGGIVPHMIMVISHPLVTVSQNVTASKKVLEIAEKSQ